MKKTQWQFTHRPDNQADINRILREAREDGLTLVEVKGGPEKDRGVYLDRQTIKPNKKHWPKDFPFPESPARSFNQDGWVGPYLALANAVKRAHELFCKNLEAASKSREYPPTVSVRAAGPEVGEYAPVRPVQQRWLPKPGELFVLSGFRPEFSVFKAEMSELLRIEAARANRVHECVSVDPPTCDRSEETIAKYGNCIYALELGLGIPEETVIRTKVWTNIAQVKPAPAPSQPAATAEPYFPAVGDRFTVAAKSDEPGRRIAFRWAQVEPHSRVLICRVSDRDFLQFTYEDDGRRSGLTPRAYEFRKAPPYIPAVGDWFTAKGTPGVGALTETVHRPHQDVYRCLDVGNLHLSAMHPEYKNPFEMTKSYYEFRKVQK